MKRFISNLLFLLLISSAILSASKANAETVVLKQSDARLLAIETQLSKLINAERAGRHLQLLAYDSRLAEVARAHSAEMRDKKYFSHESPTPRLQWPLNRYQEGMENTPHLVAENIFQRWGGTPGVPADSAQQAHQAFMNSPGHKANILLPSATRVGIGVVADADGNVWVTEMFSRP
jgi:uncharacterized protein YkwD